MTKDIGKIYCNVSDRHNKTSEINQMIIRTTGCLTCLNRNKIEVDHKRKTKITNSSRDGQNLTCPSLLGYLSNIAQQLDFCSESLQKPTSGIKESIIQRTSQI